VFSALTHACARPSFTRSMATRIDESFFVRIAVRTSSSMATTLGRSDDGEARLAAGNDSREFLVENFAQSHQQHFGIGMRREKVHAGGDGDRRSVVPSHGVDGDDGLHRVVEPFPRQSFDWMTFLPR